eukprot:NODE_270_length_1556_cov_465.480425_g194_i0.p1 GENE.NODE_270_length_1556_cov_465.480425_g194_i0~~NODE_270_length_1556_cov_465.480425_g194_i0.p1  ORF type:complete len:309 (+),score=121.46 NODE_270_length_1556_cov_465.480425_g194_i0:35-928(+)
MGKRQSFKNTSPYVTTMNGADDMVWDILNRTFCRFKAKTSVTPQVFCRNWYNLTGHCNCKVCPLANSQYATVREHEGKMYLYVKTIERAHLPAKLWDKILLPDDAREAMQTIDENLQWWPKHIVHMCKARMLRIKQYLRKMRRIKLKPGMKLVRIHKKEERVLDIREKKALSMAKLDQSIEKELLDRLKSGVYDTEIPINIPDSAFLSVIDKELDREEAEARQEADTLEDAEKDAEIEVDELDDVYEEDFEDEEDEEDDEAPSGKRRHLSLGPQTKRAKKDLQMEQERETLKSLIDW